MPIPITPLLTVDAVIKIPDEKIVLVKRKNPPFQGQFALPGGFVEVGETAEEACKREAFEETNIHIRIIKLTGVYSDPKRDPRGHTVTISYLCEPLTMNENPIAKTDATDLELVPIKNIESMELAFDHKKIIIDSLLKKK